MIAEHALLESCTRLSISLEQNGLFQTTTNTRNSSSSSSKTVQSPSGTKMTLEELRAVNRYAESTRSLSYLPLVHERQTERMKTRSQWFLAPSVDCFSCGGSLDMPLNEINVGSLTSAILRKSSSGTIGLSLSAESIQKRPSIRRVNSRNDKRYMHRSTSRRTKQNGSRSNSFKNRTERFASSSRQNSLKSKYGGHKGKELCSCSVRNEKSSPDGEVASKTESPKRPTAKTKETICITLTYKPRI